MRERLRGVCREGVLRKERERPLQEKRASERYDSALGGAKEGRGGVIIYCEKVMKTFQKICFLVLGLSVVVAGAWYASGSRTIGEVKLPSIPKQNCLEHNKAKHMPKTQEELASYKKAYFAGGCFWCTESDLEKALGVVEVVSGYAGGEMPNPTYRDVTSEKSGHRETGEVYYDGEKTNYENLVHYYLLHIDPTDADGQFYDRGESYQAVIFYQSEEERLTAERALRELDEAKIFDRPVAVRVLPYKNFYTAEDFHQNYAAENTLHYCAYRESSGRDAFLKKYFGDQSWEERVKKTPVSRVSSTPLAEEAGRAAGHFDFSGYAKPSGEELKAKLEALAYEVTQEEGTEKPFENAYHDYHAPGIYVDILSGEPLFSSVDKYDSGTGWPSFVKPIDNQYIVEKADWGLFGKRTEIRSRYGDNHLGHVFSDGPKERGGLRYCMNSAALRFIPEDSLEKEGYGSLLPLVTQDHNRS